MNDKRHIKRAVTEAVNLVPGVRNYLQEKHNMQNQLQEQADLIERLHETNAELSSKVTALEEMKRLASQVPKSLVLWPLFKKDILRADQKKPVKTHLRRKPPFTINWVLPTMEKASGGRADILRTIAYLEARGHICRLYFYDPSDSQDVEHIRGDIEDYLPRVQASVYYNEPTMMDADILFATNYYSAYPVYNHKGDAHKCYYVQDFEPFFELLGSYYNFAENTYRFGLRGITIGKWLSEELAAQYGMQSDYFEFGVDPKRYFVTEGTKRNGILFYARPSTPRRGFELGILALEIFHKQHPDMNIYIVGADVSNYEISFPYINSGILPLDKLNSLYNSCYGGLALSFTNMSLLPLEMLAAGCKPVVNEAPNTMMVSFADYVTYAKPSPHKLAQALDEVVNGHTHEWALRASKAAHAYSWDKSNAQIEQLLINDLQ